VETFRDEAGCYKQKIRTASTVNFTFRRSTADGLS